MTLPTVYLIATDSTAKSFPQYKCIDIIPKSDKLKSYEFWIGRHPAVNLVLFDGAVSRKHACLKYGNDVWKILDNGSSNGVMLNDSLIAKDVYTDLKHGDRIAIVNGISNFEWTFQCLSTGAPEKSKISQKILHEKEKVSETQLLLVSKIKEEKSQLHKKIQEIEHEKRQLHEQKENMAILLALEKTEFAEKQAKEKAKFEDDIKTSQKEAMENERATFKQRLQEEKHAAEEQLADKEKSMIESIRDAESRLDKLVGEKDNIVISIEFEMEQNQEKVKEMRVNFESHLKQLYLDCENEKAASEEYKNAIEDLKKNFDDMLKQNQKEMEDTITIVRIDNNKRKEETENIREEVKKQDEEIARLKEELRMKQIEQIKQHEVKMKQNYSDSQTFLSKCNEELKCSICDELFIEPMALGCGHVYCRHCLQQWEVNCGNCFAKFNCPNCRQPITQFSKSLHLDNLITSLYKGLNEMLQQERRDLIKERQAEEIAAKEKQEAEKRQKEKEQQERDQHRHRRRRSFHNGIETREIREALRDQSRQQRTNQRESHAERRRNLDERVRRMRDRLVASELQNPEPSTSTASRNTRSRVRSTVNGIRQRLITEMSRRVPGPNDSTGEELQIISSRTVQNRRTATATATSSSEITPASVAPVNAQIVDLVSPTEPNAEVASRIRPSRQDNMVDLTGDNEISNDPNEADTDLSSSQSSTSSDSSTSSSTQIDDSVTFSDSSVEGIEGYYYGGYGECFNCGRRGHWAPGCPY